MTQQNNIEIERQSQQQKLPEFEGFSLRKSENTLNICFPISQVLPIMADLYTEEASKSLMTSTAGILKKYCFNENLTATLQELSNVNQKVLKERFFKELTCRFSKNDKVSLKFYQDVIHFEVTGISKKSTHDIRILFLALFVQILNEKVSINDVNIECQNSILFDEMARQFNIEITADIIVVVFSKFPFYFTLQDITTKSIVNSKFKVVERLRGH